MILLSSAQTAYVISLVLASLVLIALVILLIFENHYRKKHIRELTYLKLRHQCEINDFLLLNNYHINIDDSNIGLIDHVVISNKYIIIINDFAISGVLKGDFTSDNLLNYSKEGASIISNPLNYNINLTKRLSLFNDLSQDFLKGLVVVNNDTEILVDNMSSQFKIVKLKDLPKTIKSFDKENVKNLSEDGVVKFINYLNERNK